MRPRIAVTLGDPRGIGPEVVARALETHELIKVRVSKESPLSPDEARAPVESETSSQVAQVIGRMLVIYRRRKKDPKIVLPKESAKK